MSNYQKYAWIILYLILPGTIIPATRAEIPQHFSGEWLAGQSVLALFGTLENLAVAQFCLWLLVITTIAALSTTLGLAGNWMARAINGNVANANMALAFLKVKPLFKTMADRPARKEDGIIAIFALLFWVPFIALLLISGWHNVISAYVLALSAFFFVAWAGISTAPRRLTLTTWILPTAWIVAAALSWAVVFGWL